MSHPFFFDEGSGELFDFGMNDFSDPLLHGETGNYELVGGNSNSNAGPVKDDCFVWKIMRPNPRLFWNGETEFTKDPRTISKSGRALLSNICVAFPAAVPAGKSHANV